MIIDKQEDVTHAVLEEMHRTPDARTREILSALVKHLHAFVREVKLTEREFEEAIGTLNAIGQNTTPSHNEAMLMAGALGVSIASLWLGVVFCPIRSEEHTSELQSHSDLVCRLL